MKPWIEITPRIRVTGTGAAWLPDSRTIVISDLHIGYARAARRRGGYLPEAETPEHLASRILDIADQCSATHVVIAGDLRHSTRDMDQGELEDITRFLDRLASTLRVDIVAGNHDRGMPETLDSLVLDDITIVHHPPAEVPVSHQVPQHLRQHQWIICGHVHPTATLRDATGATARYPCFLTSEQIIVLPAFTEWAGGLRGSRLFAQLPAMAWQRFIIYDGLIFDNL